MVGRERLVIVGTGWAGFELLRGLNRAKFDIHVVSPRNYFVFTPLLASTCTGTLEFRCITEPVRRLDPAINYYQANCKGLSLPSKQIHCETLLGDQFNLTWDKLVLATGAISNTFGIPGVREHAYFLKEIEDARRIRHRILELFESAVQPNISESTRANLLHFVIVGGGPTGVEFAAELNDFIHDDLSKYYPELVKLVRITVYDVASRILGSFDHELADYAVKRFARERITISTGTKISAISEGAVELAGQSTPVKCGLVVWATGLTASPLIRQIGEQCFKMDSRQFRLLTDERFNVLTDSGPLKDIFAIGDCATIDGNDLPCTAQVAYQKARHLSKALNRRLPKDDKLGPFKFQDRGMLAYIGGWRAIADLRTGQAHHFPQSGRGAWLFWRSAYFVMTVSGILDIFSTPLIIRINLDGEDDPNRPKFNRVVIPDSRDSLGRQESCPLYHEGQAISGTVSISRRSKGPINHGEVNIYLTGVIEPVQVVAARPHTFLSSSLCLSTEGNSGVQEPVELPFNFGAVGLPYESFEGNQIQIRYAVRVVLKQTLSSPSVERTLWVQKPRLVKNGPIPPDLLSPVSLNLGLETALHLHVDLDRTVFKWNDVLKGRLHFQLVVCDLVGVDLVLFRRERIASGPPKSATTESGIAIPEEHEIIARHHVMHGAAQRGDVVPFRFHFASCLDEHTAAASHWDEKGLFSIRYFLFITIKDADEKQYYKIQEIKIIK